MSQSAPMRYFLVALILAALCVVGVYEAATVYLLRYRPTVRGTIVVSEGRQRMFVGIVDTTTSSHRSPGGCLVPLPQNMHYPHLVYEYVVDAKHYRSQEDCILPGSPASVEGRPITVILREWPLRKSVTVYYDPADHQDSCILPERRFQLLAAHLGMAAIPICLVLVLLVRAWRSPGRGRLRGVAALARGVQSVHDVPGRRI